MARAFVFVLAVVLLVLPAPAVAQPGPREPPLLPTRDCDELEDDWRDSLSFQYGRYEDQARDNVDAFRDHARQAKRTRDRPFLERAFATAKRRERRVFEGAKKSLRSAHDAYVFAAQDYGCDPEALRPDYDTFATQLGRGHRSRMRKIRLIYNRYA